MAVLKTGGSFGQIANNRTSRASAARCASFRGVSIRESGGGKGPFCWGPPGVRIPPLSAKLIFNDLRKLMGLA